MPERGPRGHFLPGNLAAGKDHWRALWRRRAIRREDVWVRPLIRQFAGSLLSDKPDASEAEKHVIETAAVSRGVQALVLAALKDGGGVSTEQGMRLLPVLARFMDIETRALLALGLARRAKPVDPLQAVRDAVTRANERAE